METIVVDGHKITLIGRSQVDDQLNMDIARGDLTFEELRDIFSGNGGITVLDEEDNEVATYIGFSVLVYINMFENFGDFDVPAAGVCVRREDMTKRLDEVERLLAKLSVSSK